MSLRQNIYTSTIYYEEKIVPPEFHLYDEIPSSHLIKIQPSKLFFSSPNSPSFLGDNFDKTAKIFSIENAAEPYGYLASVHLAQKLATVPERKAFIESVVIGNKGASWNDIKLVLILSLSNGGPEWTFGIFDDLHRNLCSGFYDSLQGQVQFATDAIGYLVRLSLSVLFSISQHLNNTLLGLAMAPGGIRGGTSSYR